MKRLFCVLAVLVLLGGCGPRETLYSSSGKTLSLVPLPVKVSVMNEKVSLENGYSIDVNSAEATAIANLLRDNLNRSGLSENKSGTALVLTINANDTTLRAEGYRMTVNEDSIKIIGRDGAGLFYGTQTLVQLVGANGKTIPVVTIDDYPRFPYRGMHLDVGRHMFPVEFIKKYIDLMAHHKMNRFHWHLTEDQGWRIEIKKYPLLQEKAAFRKETVIGHATTATRSQLKNFDGTPYGGYYTQDEIRDVVRYAAERYVTIIPEIELPGHSLAALSAYPHLGCTGGPYEAATTWGVFDDVYCAGKEETFTFLQDVLDEVMALFPSEYIHIGGDECPKTQWKKCPHCQKRMREMELQDEHQLQSYFVRRIEKYLNKHDRQIIGWDEILEGGLAPNATVMSWRGEQGGIAAARAKHAVIMTPGNWCYFDRYQDTTGSEPLAIGGYTPVEKVYSYEPVPDTLSPSEAAYIRGAQANLWTEYIKTPEHVEYMVYPRACAMAEVLWTPSQQRNYGAFEERLKVHLKRLNAWNLNYAKHILTDREKVSNSGSK